MNTRDLLAEMAAMNDEKLFIVAAYFVGCFGGVMAGRKRYDLEVACCSFLQQLHELTDGVTPPPPVPPRHS